MPLFRTNKTQQTAQFSFKNGASFPGWRQTFGGSLNRSAEFPRGFSYPKKSLRRQRHSRLRRRGVQALPTTVTGSCIQLNLRCVHLMRHVEYNLRPLDDNASSSEGTDDFAFPAESPFSWEVPAKDAAPLFDPLFFHISRLIAWAHSSTVSAVRGRSKPCLLSSQLRSTGSGTVSP